MSDNHDHDRVSVILPVRNEAAFIGSTLQSLLRQECRGFEIEILVVEGKSTDGTRTIAEHIAASDSRVRVLTNEKQVTPSAFNIGLQHATGKYICILGAHARYPRDYIATCLDELIRMGAVACSGRVITEPATPLLQSRLVAWAMGHPFGSSPGSCRTKCEGFVDTVSYPVAIKSKLVEAGGYNEQLHRNQDLDMNQRLRARGHKLFTTGKTASVYFARPTIMELVKYSFRTSYWNVISLRLNGACMRPRHFIPFAFVVALLASIALAVVPHLGADLNPNLAIVPLVLFLSYSLASALAACHVCMREGTAAALLLPPVFFLFHVSYGAGILWAFMTNARISGSRTPATENESVAPTPV